MAAGKVWIFDQLGGDQKQLILAGWSAPFGRARASAIVKTAQKARAERVYYPGSNTPTRHTFGVRLDDWELKGRFRDRELGPGGAREKAAEVLAFQRDQQPIRIAWGDVLSFTGFMVEFEPAYEAEHEIEWTMRLEIDGDDTQVTPSITAPGSPVDAAGLLQDAFKKATDAIDDLDLSGSFIDPIDALTGAFVDAVEKVKDAVGDLKQQTLGNLTKVLIDIDYMRSKALELRNVFTAIPAEVGQVRAQAVDTLAFLHAQATVEDQLREALNEGAVIERAVDLAIVGRIQATYTASDGDTFESMSRRFYGTSDRAGEIRDANGVPSGQNPIAGVEYLIPK